MSIATSLSNFRASIVLVNSYIASAFVKAQDGNDLFDSDGKDFVISAAYLKLFIAWETFLEEAFSKYLIGEVSTGGTSADRFVTITDRDHALKMMIGTQKYVDWANHEIVRRLANLYLKGGEPIQTNVSAVALDLADMKTVRNAAAHLSSTTQTQLNSLATRVLGKPSVGMTVANFVTQIHPANGTSTVLQYYIDTLDATAENIAANKV